MGTKLSFFIHYPKMMLGFSSNSAERRQKCTTTIRSCRAHPRRVLDTAALNAYVPDYVGSKSKSRSELTWNHVVAVFTFFGLPMTALMSLCCWSHFQFIVERRRLALKDNVTVTGSPQVNGTYRLTGKDEDIKTTIPKWFKTPKLNDSNQIHIFGGSNKIDDNKWPAHAGEQWYLCTASKNPNNVGNVIFFDQKQDKWHMGGKDGLMYRTKGKSDEMPTKGWLSQLGRVLEKDILEKLCDACKKGKNKSKSCRDKDCKGPKPHFAIGEKSTPPTVQ